MQNSLRELRRRGAQRAQRENNEADNDKEPRGLSIHCADSREGFDERGKMVMSPLQAGEPVGYRGGNSTRP